MNNHQANDAANAEQSAVDVAVADSAAVTQYPIPHPFEYQGKFYQGYVELHESLGDPVTRFEGGRQVATGEFYYDIFEVLMVDGRPVQALKRVGGGIFNPNTSH
ncbi:MAG: hypothetical protein IPI39_11750 [Candidatus Obscuribacter sp.]|jgi:hypothetical protein|nr:hypothetical protein [Candidatus Obscuribacter sp.]